MIIIIIIVFVSIFAYVFVLITIVLLKGMPSGVHKEEVLKKHVGKGGSQFSE